MLKLEACGFLAQGLCLTPIAIENGKGRGRKTSASLAKDARDQRLVAGNYRSGTYALNINSQKSPAEVKLCVCVAIPGGQWEITTFRTEQNATSLLFSVHRVQLASVITCKAKGKQHLYSESKAIDRNGFQVEPDVGCSSTKWIRELF